MKIKLLKSKLHRAKVTDANLDYEGSISIDSELMKKVGLNSYEKVHVLNLTNGSRLETYVIPDDPGSKSICINGAAAHLVHPEDRVIILSYCSLDATSVSHHMPRVARLNQNNDVVG